MLRLTNRKRSSTRRTQHRAIVSWPAEWRSFADESGGHTRVRDVSDRGVFVEVPERLPPLPLGSPVRLWLNPVESGREQLTLLGTVRWRGLSATHGCPGIGVELFEPEARLAREL